MRFFLSTIVMLFLVSCNIKEHYKILPQRKIYQYNDLIIQIKKGGSVVPKIKNSYLIDTTYSENTKYITLRMTPQIIGRVFFDVYNKKGKLLSTEQFYSYPQQPPEIFNSHGLHSTDTIGLLAFSTIQFKAQTSLEVPYDTYYSIVKYSTSIDDNSQTEVKGNKIIYDPSMNLINQSGFSHVSFSNFQVTNGYDTLLLKDEFNLVIKPVPEKTLEYKCLELPHEQFSITDTDLRKDTLVFETKSNHCSYISFQLSGTQNHFTLTGNGQSIEFTRQAFTPYELNISEFTRGNYHLEVFGDIGRKKWLIEIK